MVTCCYHVCMYVAYVCWSICLKWRAQDIVSKPLLCLEIELQLMPQKPQQSCWGCSCRVPYSSFSCLKWRYMNFGFQITCWTSTWITLPLTSSLPPTHHRYCPMRSEPILYNIFTSILILAQSKCIIRMMPSHLCTIVPLIANRVSIDVPGSFIP